MIDLSKEEKLKWFNQVDIRPYVFVREENRVRYPGSLFESYWFSQSPLYLNPLLMKEVHFANQILKLESLAFQKSGMAMDRWVFYDCAVIPGFVAGFAQRRSSLSQELVNLLSPSPELEWVPLSLFIVIPTMSSFSGEWVAHNLCSVNSLLKKENQFYGLGFLTKAFALWYANIDRCLGITQWGSPATILHTHYGEFELVTAYTPIHNYPKTLTYRLTVNTHYWEAFFSKNHSTVDFEKKFIKTPYTINPSNEDSMKEIQSHLELDRKKYYLNPEQMRHPKLYEELDLYEKI